jgi:hypothetical protein
MHDPQHTHKSDRHPIYIDPNHLRRRSKNTSSGRSSNLGKPSLDRVANPTARPSYRKISSSSPPAVGASCCDHPTVRHRILQTQKKHRKTHMPQLEGSPARPCHILPRCSGCPFTPLHTNLERVMHILMHPLRMLSRAGPSMHGQIKSRYAHVHHAYLTSQPRTAIVRIIFIVNLSMDSSVDGVKHESFAETLSSRRGMIK